MTHNGFSKLKEGCRDGHMRHSTCVFCRAWRAAFFGLACISTKQPLFITDKPPVDSFWFDPGL
ncbi:hypothetical protein GOZ91_27380 [Agrobacterium vitis]|nr:hypothetical protein [Agrobacterium vitis]